MKYLLALTLSLFALSASGQTTKGEVTPLNASLVFSVQVPNPVQTFPSDFGDHIIYGTITNLSDSTIHLQFHRYQRPPQNWTTSVCFGTLCLAPTADSARNLFTFGPHVSEPLLLHFNDTSTNMIPVTDTVRVELVVQKEPGLATDTVILHFVQMTSTTSAVSVTSKIVSAAPTLSIYPNPSNSSNEVLAQVSTTTGGSGTLRIFGMDGTKLREVTLRERFQPGTNVVRFDPAGLSAGAYLLSVSLNGTAEVSKVFQVVR